MFNMKRNQIIITALVVMIAVAGYLSYNDNKSVKQTNGIELTDSGELNPLILGEDTDENALTNSEVITDDIGIALTPEDAAKVAASEEGEDGTESIFVNAPESDSVKLSATGENFFVSAKITRENQHSKQKTSYTELMNNKNISEDKRAEVADNLLELQERIAKENAAETMLEAKGFKEVYVRIDDVTVDVVVNKENLSDAEIAQIQDIVQRKTGMAVDKIKISPYKKSK